MARKLKDQKKIAYDCHAKKCPAPADFRRFPELMRAVKQEWHSRLQYQRSGEYRARRASAKARWKGNRKLKKQGKRPH